MIILTACDGIDLQAGIIIKNDIETYPRPITLKVPVTNNGDNITKLALIVNNNKFDVSIDPMFVDLEKGVTKNITIFLKAKSTTSPGDELVKIMYEADGKKGKLDDVLVTVRKKNLKIIPKFLKVDNEVETEMIVNVKNEDIDTYPGINIFLEPLIRDLNLFKVTRKVSENIKSIHKTNKGWRIELDSVPTGTLKVIFMVKVTNPTKTNKVTFELRWYLAEGGTPLNGFYVKSDIIINP